MSMQTVFLLVALSINIIIAAGFILSFILLKKSIDHDNNLKEQMFLFSLPISTEENFTILDVLIQDEVDIYTIYNFPMADDLFLSDEDINSMMVQILSRVMNKVSPVYLNKLKYIYNEGVIEDIIYGKVRDSVLKYSIDINGTFRDLDKKKYPTG